MEPKRSKVTRIEMRSFGVEGARVTLEDGTMLCLTMQEQRVLHLSDEVQYTVEVVS